jgi:RND family efflux transporter MFP subunit
LDQAIAKKGQDAANLISADKDLTRVKTLAIKSFETQQTVDQTQAKVDGYKASIKADEAAIESARTQLDYTTVVSPISGRVGIRQIDLGTIIHANDSTPLGIITQTQRAAVIFALPQIQLEPVRDAMARGAVEVVVFDRNNVRALATGKLLLIDALIDQATSTIRLKAMFPNTDERLWPGEFVNARVLLNGENNVVTIPSTALQRGPAGVFTWVIGGDGRSVRKIGLRPRRRGCNHVIAHGSAAPPSLRSGSPWASVLHYSRNKGTREHSAYRAIHRAFARQIQGSLEVMQFLHRFGYPTLTYFLVPSGLGLPLSVRRVRLNEPHPAHVTPSWYGDSVGHYEGDTLVIDTIGTIDWFGTPHTEALHVVERYRLLDYEAAIQAEERGERENFRLPRPDNGFERNPDYKGKGLQLEFTLEDPGVFTTPWSATMTYRRPLGEWGEVVCANPQLYPGKYSASGAHPSAVMA